MKIRDYPIPSRCSLVTCMLYYSSFDKMSQGEFTFHVNFLWWVTEWHDGLMMERIERFHRSKLFVAVALCGQMIPSLKAPVLTWPWLFLTNFLPNPAAPVATAGSKPKQVNLPEYARLTLPRAPKQDSLLKILLPAKIFEFLTNQLLGWALMAFHWLNLF